MKNILLIVMCFFLASCDESAETKEERSKSIAESKELSRKCRENRYAYYQIDDVIFKLPTNSKIYASYEGEAAYHKCQTSVSNPLQVDTLKLGVPFNLKSYEGRFGFRVQIKSSETQKFNPYGEVQNALAAQGKTLRDLELVEGFYKYIIPSKNPHVSEAKLAQYISLDTAMISDTGVPLVLKGCRDEKSALLCNSHSELNERLFMTTYASGDFIQMSTEVPIAAWKEIYPQIVQKINSYRVPKAALTSNPLVMTEAQKLTDKLSSECEEIEKQQDQDVILIVGKVFSNDINYPNADCFDEVKCKKFYKKTKSVRLIKLELSGDKRGSMIWASTAPRLISELRGTEPILEVGKKYAFCAYQKQYEHPLQQKAHGHIYAIYMDTIQQLETDKN